MWVRCYDDRLVNLDWTHEIYIWDVENVETEMKCHHVVASTKDARYLLSKHESHAEAQAAINYIAVAMAHGLPLCDLSED